MAMTSFVLRRSFGSILLSFKVLALLQLTTFHADSDLLIPVSTGPFAWCPYSFNLLWSVFRLMPRLSAARVLLLFVDSSVFRMSCRSASSTVVPTPTWMALGSELTARGFIDPKPGGRCLVSISGPVHRIIARSSVLHSSRTLPGKL